MRRSPCTQSTIVMLSAFWARHASQTTARPELHSSGRTWRRAVRTVDWLFASFCFSFFFLLSSLPPVRACLLTCRWPLPAVSRPARLLSDRLWASTSAADINLPCTTPSRQAGEWSTVADEWRCLLTWDIHLHTSAARTGHADNTRQACLSRSLG